ncbi:Phenylacetic acid degradation operon negative regulatory protein paaX [Serratia fonticola]|uniref:Phenylacetic acid degradation operon negative regulatory protein paaX n=1 Tax=Serratia fonticola TaxID=47917 RepID=A0A4U9WNQ6_SERFO|nr:Phenylacetic acid degradation operon negative regulatory protein paaX [Serratia fonticola]
MRKPTSPPCLASSNASEQVIYFRADYPYNRSEQTLRQMVANCWSLSEVAGYYHEFIVSFRPLMALLREADEQELTPLRCFQIKLLLIHFFRRVVLKDPLLPDALLPAQWEGQIARNLCINIYQRVDRAATEYVSAFGRNLHRHLTCTQCRLLSPLWRTAARSHYILRSLRYARVSD